MTILTTLLILAVNAVVLRGSQNVLVMPAMYGKNSHLYNMEKVANILADARYKVTILTNPVTRPFLTSTKAKFQQVNTILSNIFITKFI